MAEFFHILVRTSVDDIVQKFGLYYEATAGGTGPRAAQSAATAWTNQCLAGLRACLAPEARVESVYCRKVDGTTVPAWRGNLNNQVGTGAGGANSLSAQNCMLVNLRNGAGLLERPGRIFVSGVSDQELTDGVLRVAFITATVQPWADTLKSIAAGGSPPWSGDLRVRRTVIAGIPQVPPVYVAVDSLDVTRELGTQHRRKGELTGYRA